jgi:hypothetical protein
LSPLGFQFHELSAPASIAAGKELLDRGYGKVKQGFGEPGGGAIPLSADVNAPDRLNPLTAQLRDRIAKRAAAAES